MAEDEHGGVGLGLNKTQSAKVSGEPAIPSAGAPASAHRETC
jgi:hypothetical protein